MAVINYTGIKYQVLGWIAVMVFLFVAKVHILVCTVHNYLVDVLASVV